MKVILFFFSLMGISLIIFFSPYLNSGNLTDCSGNVCFEGRIIDIFYSQKGNRIGIIETENAEIMAVLNDFVVEDGKYYEFCSSLSQYQDSCWAFPERVIEID